MPDTLYKSATFETKALTDAGEFTATIATLNHIDLDGDVTVPGAFPSGKTVWVAQWGHNWGALPYGLAVLREEGDTVKADGRFNLNTTHGRDAYETVKAGAMVQEWSYGFKVVKSSDGEFEGRRVRFLEQLDVAEISPVMRGAAGPGMSALDAIKSHTTFEDNAEAALAVVSAFAERAASLADLRAKSGRALSEVNRERIARVRAALGDVAGDLEALLGPDDDGKAIDAWSLLVEYEALMARTKHLVA